MRDKPISSFRELAAVIPWPFYFIAGALVQDWILTDPIHEFGHVLAATLCGNSAEITSWSRAMIYGNIGRGARFVISWGGLFFETFFFAGVGLLASKKGRKSLAAFATGHMLMSFFMASGYTDISSIGYAGVPLWYCSGVVWITAYLANIMKHYRARRRGRRADVA